MNKKKIDIDCVIIGVNAAKTLKRCLESVLASRYKLGKIQIYYVDGGSSDGSIDIANSFPGVNVIEMDVKYPTPGIGRNAGWLMGQSPMLQFLDSDTVIDPDWIEKGVSAMSEGVGALRGRREEMRPEASVFNWIGNLEWNAPSGDCDAFGGDVLIRRSILEDTGGYDEILVGGEDPELSQRVRLIGWKILQLDEPMTMHDLAIDTLWQYLKRGYRTGYGYAAVTLRHGFASKGFWFYEFIRILIRGGGFIALASFAVLGSFFAPLALLLIFPALLLFLYPRLFRVSYFMEDKKLSRDDAKIYAWHCTAIVAPEFFGILRYFMGALFGSPIRNKKRSLRTGLSSITSILLFLPLFIGLMSCASVKEDVAEQGLFVTAGRKIKENFATSSAVEAFSNEVASNYLLGPGDVLSLKVWNRPDISNSHIVVGPDGKISVIRIGLVYVKNRSRENVAAEIVEKLSSFYEKPEVFLSVKVYKNNKAFVLGRVSNPGVVEFPGEGTLLEALSLAGGLPVLERRAFLSKCAIIRGKDKIIWIDLKELLNNGNMALNSRIKNNDVIFIPESEDELVYVMGEVRKPGAIRLKSELTFMDVLMMSGGPTDDANLKKAFIIRVHEGKRVMKEINIKEILKGGIVQNYLLQDNDVIYVAEKGMSKFNYAISQILPSLQVLDMSTATLERFGVMQEIRKDLWGQEGFVDN